MSRIFTVREIVDRALRKIGAYSIRDQGADGDEAIEAMFWLDMMVARRFSNQRTFMVSPATINVPLTTNVSSYTIDAISPVVNTEAGAVEYVSGCYLVCDNGNGQPTRRELKMVERQRFEDEVRGTTKTGWPCSVYISRGVPVVLQIHPIPVFTTPTTWSLDLVVQRAPMDFTLEDEERAMRMRSCFNMWAVVELAYWCGTGAVRRLGRDQTDAWKDEADELWADLIAADMQENISDPPRTGYNDF
jgi:hypothetical protein